MGTIAALRRGYRADGAVVPEPTGLDIWVAFRGIFVGELRWKGARDTSKSPSRTGRAEARSTRCIGCLAYGTLAWARLALAQPARQQHPLCSTGELM